MNPRILIVVAIVLVVLVLGGMAAYFFVFAKQEPPPKSPEEIAMTTDDDGDGSMNAEETAAGTDPKDPSRFPGSHKKVMVARSPIAANTLLKDDLFAVREVAAKGDAPDAAVLESEKRRVIGKVSATGIEEGEFVVEAMVYGGKPQLSFLVPKYKRAYSLTYDELPAVGGNLELGDIVDVVSFFTVNREEGRPIEYAKIIIQSAKIVAKGTQFTPKDPTDTSPPVVPTSLTLSLYPHEVEKIIWAENYAGGGVLKFALRAPVNDAFARTLGTTENSVFSSEILNTPRRVELYTAGELGDVVRFDPVKDDRVGLQVVTRQTPKVILENRR